MSTTPVFGITLGEEGQASGWPTANELFRKLELLAGTLQFIDFNLNTPPGSPAEGDTYWTGGSPTGDWATHDHEIVTYFNAEWIFIDPKSDGLDIDGIYAFKSDQNQAIVFSTTTDSWGSIARMQSANVFEAGCTFEDDVTLETGIVQEEFGLSAVGQAFTPNFNVAARQIADCSGFSTGNVTLNNCSNLTTGKAIHLLIIGPAADLLLQTSVSWNALDGSLTTLVAGEDVEVTFYCRGATQADVWYRITRAVPRDHTIDSHSDTSATGTELDELTGGGATTLHSHSGVGDLDVAGDLTLDGDLVCDTDGLVFDQATGRVGIGTASPGYPLHVEALISALMYTKATNAYGIGGIFCVNNQSRDLRIAAYGSSYVGTEAGVARAGLALIKSHSGFSSFMIRSDGSGPFYLVAGNTVALTIDGSTQDVSTTADLAVGVDASVGGDLTVTGGATFDGTTLVVDDANNRVGIGTASPSVQLHGSNTTFTARFQSTGSTLSATSEVKNDAGKVFQVRMQGSAKTGTTLGISNANLGLFYGSGSAMMFNQYGATPIYLATNSTVALTIDGSTQDVSVENTLEVDTIDEKTASAGITFGADVSAAIENGVTGSRPGSPRTWQMYGDTTLGIPIWYDGTNWVDATGATV
ncbi:MAG: DUF2793 domain-containing protein [bacterium]|nr:DUF2793 domain-containing protein [bacterium]